MGRTARQRGDGICSMVLIDKELEKYDISLKNIKKKKKNDLYEFLHSKRNLYFAKESAENKRFVKNGQTSHLKAQRLT